MPARCGCLPDGACHHDRSSRHTGRFFIVQHLAQRADEGVQTRTFAHGRFVIDREARFTAASVKPVPPVDHRAHRVHVLHHLVWPRVDPFAPSDALRAVALAFPIRPVAGQLFLREDPFER
eukprot:1114410-Pleurochrysis_carterae.AAC.2